MGISHDIESILEAARQLKKSDNILFLFIGGGKKYQLIIDYKNKYELINIAIFPYQSEEDLPFTMSLSSISLVALGHGSEKLMIPSKVFHYMASGAALIGICHGDNELKSIILNNNCGVCVEPERPNELVFAINDIINNEDKLMSYRKESRMTAIKYFSTNIGVSQFVSILGDKGIL
jgi:glycosyltransferase involved in cell wall biosynthesis